MSRFYKLLKVLLGVCVCLGAVGIVPGVASAAASSTVTIDVNRVENPDFLGIGAEYDPFQFMPESLGDGFGDDWWEMEKQRIRQVHPNVVRVWYQMDWMEPQNDNDDPAVIDWSGMQTDSTRMQAVYKVLDFLKEEQIEVMLIAGLVMTPENQSWMGYSGLPRPELSAPKELSEWSEWVSATLQQLMDVKGYDNIKYVMSYNEPNLAGFAMPDESAKMSYYQAMYQSIHDRLTTDGLRSRIKLVGPDESGGLSWMQFAAANMDGVLDIYDAHAYGQTYATMPKWFADRFAAVEPTGKPLMVTEFAGLADPVTRKSYQYGVSLADLMISGMNHGAAGMLYWRLADQRLPAPLNFLDDSSYGTWRWLPITAVPQYSYYVLGLFSYYGGAHSQVLSSTSSDPELHVSSLKRPDGNYSVFVVNSSATASKSVTFNFTSALNRTVSRHLYTGTIAPDASANLIPSDAVWNQAGSGFTDAALPPNSVAVYTTVEDPMQIRIAPGEWSAAWGSQVDLDAEVLGGTGGVTWSVLGGPAFGTIDGNGVYTAPAAMPSSPQAMIRATSVENPAISNVAVVRFHVSGLSAGGRDSMVRLDWQPVLGATGYNIKRSTVRGGPYTVVAAGVTGTSYSDRGLTNDTRYYYVVSAVNSYGETGNSREAFANPTSNRLTDDFNANSIDPAKWTVIDRGFRSNASTGMTAEVIDGVLHLGGTTGVNYWGGRSVQSVATFNATADAPLSIEVDRVSLAGSGTGYRSALWLYVSGSQYIHFSQNGEFKVWGFNLNGGGDQLVWDNNERGNHRMKLIHDGSTVHIFVDDIEYASAPVSWNSNMKVVLTGEARQKEDTIDAAFDNVKVQSLDTTGLPAIPKGVTAQAGSSLVSLSWSPAEGAKSYTVKRRTANGQPYTTVATGITSTRYTDTGLTNGTAYQYVVTSVNDSSESLHSLQAMATPFNGEVIVDNESAKFTGVWGRSQSMPGYYGADYSMINAGTGAGTARWQPQLPKEGTYGVYYWLPDGSLPNGTTNRPHDAEFTVSYDGGSQTYTVNEQLPGGEWVLLGKHRFLAGNSGYVQVTDKASGGYVIADAVKFVLQEEATALQVAPVNGVYSDTAMLQAVLTQQGGRPVAGETVVFTVNGAPAGSAVTDADGMAVLEYKVPWGAAADSDTALYTIQASFTGNKEKYLAGSQGTGSLTVVKEESSLSYEGTVLAPAGEAVTLAARILELDAENGRIEGLPVQFTIRQVNKDFTLAERPDSVTGSVYLTDGQGRAAVDMNLAPGLYTVQASLVPNGFYKETSAPASLLLLYDTWSGKTEIEGSLGSTDPVRFRAKLQLGSPGQAPEGKWKIVSEAQGVNLEILVTDWSVNGNTLQAAGQHAGQLYTVHFTLLSTAGDDQPEASLTVWQGAGTDSEPVVQSLQQPLYPTGG